jgi:hypothetical protein
MMLHKGSLKFTNTNRSRFEYHREARKPTNQEYDSAIYAEKRREEKTLKRKEARGERCKRGTKMTTKTKTQRKNVHTDRGR